MACTRSVPTSDFDDSRGYKSISRTIISDPEPTDVIPTIRPPTAPTATLAIGFVPGGLRRSRARAPWGWILKSSTGAGVRGAPHPIPVGPTVNPPAKPASMSSATRALPATPRPAAGVDGDAVLFQHERRQLL